MAWIALSFTVDTNRRELRLLAEAVQRCRPDGVLADFPAGGPLDEVDSMLAAGGYGRTNVTLRGVDCGDPTVRTRRCLVGLQGVTALAPPQLRLDGGRRSMAPLLSKEPIPDGAWPPQDAQVVWDPCISTTGDRMLLIPCGSARLGSGGKRRLIYSPDGPAATAQYPGAAPEGPGAMLIRGARAGGHWARSLLPIEVWRLQGRHASGLGCSRAVPGRP